MSLASLNPNAEVEREARLALNFGVRAKFPQGLSEDLEAFPHVRDLRLLGRVDQTALVQEAFDDGTNLVFQEFTGSFGDDEVVRGAHQVDFRVPQDLGALLPTRVETCFATCNSSSSPSSARFASCRREDYALRCSGFRREPSPTLDVYRWCRATGRRRQLCSPRHSPRSDWSPFLAYVSRNGDHYERLRGARGDLLIRLSMATRRLPRWRCRRWRRLR